MANFDKGSRGRPTQKRKWREIEAIKEQFRLRKELKEFDFADEIDLDSIEV
ncbi:DUF3545 family protein [Algibacillus agarilyticus]|uniref:DUF3545 family protein n=1 Tax=Algibacillus agarilyticus TaxID=2234133 RepID=UPI001E2ED2CC